MDPSNTALGAYGFASFTGAPAGGMSLGTSGTMPETALGVSGNIPGPALPALPINWHNPLFWLLILALVWSGYIYGAFDIGFKKLGSGKLKLG
jgi:hypothetical protein